MFSNGCIQKWSFDAFEMLYPILENASERIPRSKSEASKSRPLWAAHTRIGTINYNYNFLQRTTKITDNDSLSFIMMMMILLLLLT